MTAQDNLSPKQFMSTEAIGKLHSNNFRGHTVEEWHQAYRAGLRGSPAEDDEGNEIPNHVFDRDIATNGINEPVIVDNLRNPTHLYEGHHRYSSARTMGLEQVPVQEL